MDAARTTCIIALVVDVLDTQLDYSGYHCFGEQENGLGEGNKCRDKEWQSMV